MKQFFLKNKVLIVGLLSAVLLAVSELVKGGEASIKMLVFSGVIAALTFLARNLRGQIATMSALFGNALAAFLTQSQTGHVEWSQLVLQTLISLLGALSAPAKSLGYEKTDTILDAKKEGEVIQPTNIQPNPKNQS